MRTRLKLTIARQFLLRLGSVESLAAKYKVSTEAVEDANREMGRKHMAWINFENEVKDVYPDVELIKAGGKFIVCSRCIGLKIFRSKWRKSAAGAWLNAYLALPNLRTESEEVR